MAEQLSGGNVALALLANSIATGGALVMLIFTFAPISGAHFNPLVTLVAATRGLLAWRAVPAYIAMQTIGAIGGVLLAHRMFDLQLLQLAQRERGGTGASRSSSRLTSQQRIGSRHRRRSRILP